MKVKKVNSQKKAPTKNGSNLSKLPKSSSEDSDSSEEETPKKSTGKHQVKKPVGNKELTKSSIKVIV